MAIHAYNAAMDLSAALKLGRALNVKGMSPKEVEDWMDKEGYTGLTRQRIIKGWEDQERKG
jgi:hypothetical protein